MQPPSFVSTLRATSWRDLAGWGLAALFLISIAKALAPDAFQPFLRSAALALPMLLYLERGAYGTATAVVFVSLLLELPVHVLLLNLFVEEADTLALLHALGAVAVAYTLAWVLGDRWHVGAGRHVMTDDALHLRVGARVQGVLPLAAIARIEKVEVQLPLWRRRHRVPRHDTLLVTPFDQPNCVLVLADEARVDILHWQATKRLPRYVLLYLDRPELLAARLARRDQA